MQIQLKNKSIELYQHRDHKNKQAQHETKKLASQHQLANTAQT